VPQIISPLKRSRLAAGTPPTGMQRAPRRVAGARCDSGECEAIRPSSRLTRTRRYRAVRRSMDRTPTWQDSRRWNSQIWNQRIECVARVRSRNALWLHRDAAGRWLRFALRSKRLRRSESRRSCRLGNRERAISLTTTESYRIPVHRCRPLPSVQSLRCRLRRGRRNGRR